MSLRLDRAGGRLLDAKGRLFDPATRTWRAAALHGASRQRVSPQEAARWLQKESGRPFRVPAGVVGPRAASPAQLAQARALGRGLATMGLSVLCGGRGGVMEAVCQGVGEGGGLAVGLLPDTDWEAANPYVGLALASGLGEARNAVIARAAFCLVALGGGHGTLSEMALALQFGRPVLALAGAPEAPGAVRLETVEAALRGVAERLLGLD